MKENIFSTKHTSLFDPGHQGKGELQTYWLHTRQSTAPMSDLSSSEDSFAFEDLLTIPKELFDYNRSKMGLGTNAIRQCLSEQNQRLADWNSNQLLHLLDHLVAYRDATLETEGMSKENMSPDQKDTILGSAHLGVGQSSSILQEARDVIEMPHYDAKVFVKAEHTSGNLNELVQQQLCDYVSIVCSMYVDNPFHSYQHASHVTMSIIKLFSSLSSSNQNNKLKRDDSKPHYQDEKVGAELHSKTFGISSDPMAHFALAFAALIHDVGTFSRPS